MIGNAERFSDEERPVFRCFKLWQILLFIVVVFLYLYSVCQKRPPFCLVNNSVKISTEFDKFWYTMSWTNSTLESYILAILIYKLQLHYPDSK